MSDVVRRRRITRAACVVAVRMRRIVDAFASVIPPKMCV
jgi:hypothetical protein